MGNRVWKMIWSMIHTSINVKMELLWEWGEYDVWSGIRNGQSLGDRKWSSFYNDNGGPIYSFCWGSSEIMSLLVRSISSRVL